MVKKVITSAEETLHYEHTYKDNEMDQLRIDRPKNNRVSEAVSKRPSRLVQSRSGSRVGSASSKRQMRAQSHRSRAGL